jgi:ribosomal protein S18 acetylase RimI-like enzyme
VTVVVDPLANPVWHALGGPQAALAEAKGRVRRFQPDVSVFGALPDAPDADDWDALRALVGAGESAFLIRDSIDAPDDWTTTFELPCVQMVLEGEITPGPLPEHVALGTADVPEMTDLVARTEPGPWRPRTVEFGGYIGVRDRGALIAMAGERMRPPGFTEISAVCTEPEYRGRGLAGGLTRVVAAAIAARGDRPMLHASAHNASAVRLYESLGFRQTRPMVAMALRAPE